MKLPELTLAERARIARWGTEGYHKKLADLARARDIAVAKMYHEYGGTHTAKLTGWSRTQIMKCVERCPDLEPDANVEL